MASTVNELNISVNWYNFKDDFVKEKKAKTVIRGSNSVKALQIINDICSCLQTDCVREREYDFLRN